MLFSELPTEVKLSVLSHSDSASLTNINEEWNNLTQYINNQKLQHYLADGSLSVSLFCVNSKPQNKKLYYKLNPTTSLNTSTSDSQSIKFALSELVKTEDLLELVNKPKSYQSDQIPNGHLDLSVNEEQSSIKVYVGLLHNDKIIKEMSIRLTTDQLNSQIKKSSKGLDFQMNNSKTSLEDQEEGYQFEDVWSYSMDIESITVEKSNLIDSIETQLGHSYIVRY